MKRGVKIVLVIMVVVSILLVNIYWPVKYLRVDFLNIGQGSATILQTPEGYNILLDAGPDNSLLTEVGEVLPWWERKIDFVIISHYHADHFVGLIELAQRYEIGEVLVTSHHPAKDLLYQTLLDQASNIKITEVNLGEIWQLTDKLSWQVLSADDNHEDYNDNSLVVKVSYGQIDWLFPGDLTSVKEADLLTGSLSLDSEILNVSHHGSKYSSSATWLTAVNPELCIIQSEAGNSFGHPHYEALERLKQANCRVLRNDLEGRITVWSDGQNWWLAGE